MKIVFTSGNEKNPNLTLTIETSNPQYSTDDLEEYLARYFSRHGGMKWGVIKT
jgi:hypothetical protein